MSFTMFDGNYYFISPGYIADPPHIFRHAIAMGHSRPIEPSFGETICWALFLLEDPAVAKIVEKHKNNSRTGYDNRELGHALTGWYSSYGGHPGSHYWEMPHARVQGSRVLVYQSRGYDM